MNKSFSKSSDPNFLSVCYHYVRPPNDKQIFKRILGVSADEFKNQVIMLKTKFHAIALEDIYNYYYKKTNWSNKKTGALLTFDDGLSDHYLAAKILAQQGISGVFFIPTCILLDELPANPIIIHYGISIFGIKQFLDGCKNAFKENNIDFDKFYPNYSPNIKNPWSIINKIKSIFKYELDYKISRKILLHIYENLIKQKYPNIMHEIHLTNDQVKEMLEMGHAIGVHTHSHISVAASKLTKNDFYKEIIAPKKFLESKFNTNVYSFSYPFGEKNDYLSTKELLNKTQEYKLAFTVENILNTKNSSPLELGRYQPTSNDNVSDLEKVLTKIVLES